jgi:ribosomal protein S18 acetylase RimI-like enzyme
MHVRPVTASELPTIAACGIAGFDADPLFDHMFPDRHTYAEEYKNWWCSMLEGHLAHPFNIVVAAETDPAIDGTDTPQLVGLGVWQLWGKPLPENFTPSPLPASPAVNAEVLQEYVDAMAGMVEKYFEGLHHVHWHLNWLAVAPEWQRRGAGRKLLEWGFERADKDGLTVILEANKGNFERFYSVLGFVNGGDMWIGPELILALIRMPEKEK